MKGIITGTRRENNNDSENRNQIGGNNNEDELFFYVDLPQRNDVQLTNEKLPPDKPSSRMEQVKMEANNRLCCRSTGHSSSSNTGESLR